MRFPKELTERRQWICWRLEPAAKRGKPTKVPYNPHTGRKASSTNAQTWGTLEEAESACQQYLYNGVGFVFTADDGLVGVDIDHCRDVQSGDLNEVAAAILARAQTYTEISPSGEGLHLFFHGTMPGAGNKNTKNGVEMYGHSRYFTMTGNAFPGCPDTIADGSDILPWIHAAYIKPEKPQRKGKARAAASEPLSDAQVLERAELADQGEAFRALWDGNWQDRYASQSEADMALCCKLAFWTGRNREQMERLFRQSKLFREKWDQPHHASGATYGEETLTRALELVTDGYHAAGETPVFAYEGRYFRSKGESVYPITNFVMQPVEMISAETETQLTADLVTVRGEIFRETFMTSDFANLQRFKGILNRRTIALSYTGSEGDLELLKNCVSGVDWPQKQGVRAMGIYEHDGKMVYVSMDGAIAAGGEEVADIVQLEKYRSIQSELLRQEKLDRDTFRQLGAWLLRYNEPAKTAPILTWAASCFLKEHLRLGGIKFPHLFLIGEAGSGKSTTMERILLPIFCRNKINAASQVTAFTLMKEAASSNLVPLALDEFKPSKLDRNRLAVLYNHFRDSYDGHAGVRGRADQSMVAYDLAAPLIVAGEESPDEAAIRERSMELLFSKKDLQSAERRIAFNRLYGSDAALGRLGRTLLETALQTSPKQARHWYEDGCGKFAKELPARVINNLACGYAGLCLLEQVCVGFRLEWDAVFPLDMDACVRFSETAVRSYLLDGSTNNQSIVEQTFEIMARMGLCPEVDYTFDDTGKLLYLRLSHVYDLYTKYRRDYAVVGEVLPYSQFKKQLMHSDLFVQANVQKRIGTESRKAWIVDYALLRTRCDVAGFEEGRVVPL